MQAPKWTRASPPDERSLSTSTSRIANGALARQVASFALAAHVERMRELLDRIFESQPLDPTEAARRAMRPQLRRRFYERVVVEGSAGDFRLTLDGRAVK